MRGKNLDVSPRETHQIRTEFHDRISDRLAALRHGKQREVEDSLVNLRLSPMDKVGQVGDPDRIDLLTGEENVEN